MINRKHIYLILCSLIFMFLCFFINVKIGKSISGPCERCHTMHNYQNGTIVVSGGPYRALTKGDCAICHTGSSPDAISNIPYVNFTSDPSYDFGSTSEHVLAGGSFYWQEGKCGNGTAALGDVCVHDVDFFNSEGPYEPPGYDPNNYPVNGVTRNSTWGKQLTCAGTYGCHGDPSKEDPFAAISGAHHQNVCCNMTNSNYNCTGDHVWNSYRFLLGIWGTEDPDWEKTWSASDHNGYYAIDLYNDTVTTPPTLDSHSINYLCGECHGKFHWETNNATLSEKYASPWRRHPTDIDMNWVSGKEYGNYPGIFNGTVGGVGYYFPEVPVGNAAGEVKSQVLRGPNTDDAIVLCISCHRAHGSPYADLLRWPYDECTCGNSNNTSTKCGCFACHTSK